jgi:O-antigen ligase
MRASRALVYATAAALPAHLLSVHLGPLTTSLLEVLAVLTVIVYAVEAYASGVRPRWPGAFTGPMLLVVASFPLAAAVSPDRAGALEMIRVDFVEPALLFGVACSVLTGPFEMGRFVRAMLVGGGVVAVLVLAADIHAGAAGAPDLLASPPVYWYQRAAEAGLLLTPLIALAGALVLLTPGAFWRADRVGPLAFLLVALPAAVMTLSQAAWLSLGAVVFVLALAATHGRRRRLLGVMVPAMAALGMAALLAAPARSSLASGIRSGGGPAVGVDSRSQLWQDSVAMVRSHPLAGVGVGALGSRNAASEPLDVAHRDDPSNLLLAFWLRLGVVGLAGVLWFMSRSLRWLLALRSAAAPVRPFVVGAGAALLAVFAGGLLDTTYMAADLAAMTLGVCALLATSARLSRVRLRALVRLPLPGAAADIEPAELPMPADIPRGTGRHPRSSAAA